MRRTLTLAAAALSGLAVLSLSGAGTAQTAAPSAPPANQAPIAAPPEEAPPEVVSAPPPVATPPMQASEVTAATPPKAQVVDKPADSTVKRARYDVAILQALDKVTAETVRFEAAVGQPVRYKTLVFTVKACEQAAADEPMEDSIAYLTIDSQPKPTSGRPTPPPRQVFKGWMYASSPGLNPLQHPVYDAWLITCRANAPVIAPAPAALPAPARPVAAAKPPVSTKPAVLKPAVSAKPPLPPMPPNP
ncbi:DUF2155 domain-containing protein [Phenylobacterium aquaticum]|uniref:DUF2155 domain-containing protein n=1 Tax=Phenylobacterium aquaticum TaxID=1763816 RepID=UPI0026ED5A37|nr:DUF2155 domain-containing protein [Phenylobacterium aquaticum]